jgi:predicted nucleic acid-binding protein
MSTKKVYLLDANVLIDYYIDRCPSVIRFVDNIKAERETGECLIYVPNICIAEVFSVFSRTYFYKQEGANESEYREKKWSFINDISRDYKYKRFQHFTHLELNRYHMIHAHLVYQPAYEYLRSAHKNGVHVKDGRPQFPSAIDLLVIAQGIEMTGLYSDEEFSLVTADKLISELSKYLSGLTDSDRKRFLKGNNANNEELKNLSAYRYPVCVNAKNTYK